MRVSAVHRACLLQSLTHMLLCLTGVATSRASRSRRSTTREGFLRTSRIWKSARPTATRASIWSSRGQTAVPSGHCYRVYMHTPFSLSCSSCDEVMTTVSPLSDHHPLLLRSSEAIRLRQRYLALSFLISLACCPAVGGFGVLAILRRLLCMNEAWLGRKTQAGGSWAVVDHCTPLASER